MGRFSWGADIRKSPLYDKKNNKISKDEEEVTINEMSVTNEEIPEIQEVQSETPIKIKKPRGRPRKNVFVVA